MKKILVNLAFVLILAICFEFVANFATYNLLFFKASFNVENFKRILTCENISNWWKDIDYLSPLKTFQDRYDEMGYFSNPKRYVTYGSPKKRPIVIFGCSFAYGENLADNQTLGYKLSKYTGRTVYNFAYPSWGPAHPIYLLQNEKLLNEVKNPEYVIYVFMDFQPCRLTTENIFPKSKQSYLYYPVKKGKLQKPKEVYEFWYKSHFIRLLERSISVRKSSWDESENKFTNDSDIQATFIEVKNQIDRKWKDTKFVVFSYPANNCGKCEFSDMKKSGIIVLPESQKLNEIFENDDGSLHLPCLHPSEKAWDIIVPYITQNLKIEK